MIYSFGAGPYSFSARCFSQAHAAARVSSTLLSADGGSLKDTTFVVTNKSSQIYTPPIPDAVSEINENEIMVSPVPTFVNQNFVIASSDGEKTIAFSVISANGAVVKSGSFIGSTTISLNQPGTFSIITNDGEKIAVKKIIVR